jgi:hypothetical protein
MTAVNLRRAAAAATLVFAVPVVSGCGVNFGEQTDQIYNPATGVSDRSGQVDVLNALVVSGSKGSGTVVATLVNDSQTHADALTGVSGTGSDSSLQVTPGGPTTIPIEGLLNLADQGRIFVKGSRVVPGYLVTLTFSFRNAQSITVQAPVVSADDPAYSSVTLP